MRVAEFNVPRQTPGSAALNSGRGNDFVVCCCQCVPPCSLRENSVGLFDTSDPNPLKWKKRGVIKDPLWKGE